MKNKTISYINGIFITSLLLGILILVQLIAFRQEIRWDFTESDRYSLSRHTRDVLTMLEGPLTAVAFLDESDSGLSAVRELFREYQLACPSFLFKIVNPVKNPELTQKFEIKSHGTVVLEYGGMQRKVVGIDEERLTNSIYQLIDSRSKTIYFSQGHGEKWKNQGGSLLLQELESEHYRVLPIYLTQSSQIPEDASCLVIAGPKSAFFPDEIDQLESYLKRGGSVLVFVDPYHDSGLETFLHSHGIILSGMSIVDKVTKLPGGGDLFPSTLHYSSHPITRYLTKMTFFPVAQPIGVLEPEPAHHTIDLLVQTEISAWGESDRQSLAENSAVFDPATDTPGPVAVGISVGIANAAGIKTSRLAVFGDSDFLADSYLFMAGNRDLALNTMAWAAAREGYITVRSRDPGFTPIILSQVQQRMVFWLSLCLMPGLALITGIWVHVQWMKK